MLTRLARFAVVATLALSTPAFAIPAPMSPDELLANSDVTALVRVVSVTCTGTWVDDRSGETLCSYSAELEVLEAKKGAEPGDTLTIGFEDIPPGITGPWSVWYYPGQEIWTHLVRSGEGSTFTTLWWNALGEEVRAPDTTDLPTEPGETVQAD